MQVAGRNAVTELTAEQRAERCAWAKKMWASDSGSKEWSEILVCVSSLLSQGRLGADLVIDMFNEPESLPQTLDVLFEEHLKRKLIGDFT